MSEIDYEELIRSPLDDLDERQGNGWSVAAVGVACGLLVGWLATFGLGGEEQPDDAVPTSTTTTTTVAPVAEAADYPPGFVEITDGLAAYGNEVILGEEVITLSFTTAAKRGEDPAATQWPVGGSWLLESASGAIVESSQVIVGRFSPGAFSVQFPASALNGETEFREARVVEFLDTVEFTGSVEIPFAGEPFQAPEPVSVPVSQEVTLIFTEVELGRFLGSVEWQTTGAEMGTTVQVVATLLDENGDVVGSYRRFPDILEPTDRGVLEIYWSEPFPTGQEGAVTLSIEYTVGVASQIPVSIDFDLTDVPVGR